MWTLLLGSGPEMLGRQAFWTTTVSSPIEDAITVSGPVTAACGNDGTALNVSTFRSHIKVKWGEVHLAQIEN